MDRLESMITEQSRIQAVVFHHHLDIMNPDQRVEYIKDMVLSATHELHEALDETRWKTWRMSDNAIFLERYVNELADAYLLLMNLFLATGFTPSQVADILEAKVTLKQQLNIQRQESGY